MLVIVFGLIGFLSKEVVSKQHFDLGIFFWFMVVVSIATFLASVVMFLRALLGYHYLLLPTPTVLENYYNETLQHYNEIDESQAEKWTLEAFDEYIFDCYVKYTTQNTLNNDAKSFNLNNCIGLLIISFVSISMSYIPFYYQTLLSELI